MLKKRASDVIVLGIDSLTAVRMRSGKRTSQLLHARKLRTATLFRPAAVTPELADRAALVEAFRRVRSELGGSLTNAALLLPDSWFRLNLLELAHLPERQQEAHDVVRWSLKRTLPIAPELLRVAWLIVGRSGEKRRLLVVSAVEKTIAAIEQASREAGIEVAVIEPLGLNVWNAVAAADNAAGERLFVHISDDEFTTALFRNDEPVFLRSRNLHGDRSLAQEIRLSASYLRDNIQPAKISVCYLAGGSSDPAVMEVLRDQFQSEVRRVEPSAFVDVPAGIDIGAVGPEVVASTGVLAS